MKKTFLFLLVFLLMLGLLACGNRQDNVAATEPSDQEVTKAPTQLPTEAPTEPSVPEEGFSFPTGVSLFGVDISSMTPQEAHAAVNASLANYQLKLSVNGKTVILTQAAMGLTCAEEEILTYASQLEQNVAEPILPKLSYDVSLLRQKLASALNVAARDAAVSYSAGSDAFVIVKESSGKNVELNGILSSMNPVILSLGTELSVTAATSVVEPNITAEDPAIKDALAKANAYLGISLTYTYTPDSGGSLGSQSLTKDDIGSFIVFGENKVPSVSSSAVSSYAEKMGSKYSVAGGSGKFKTTGGSYINLTVSYAGQPVDTAALAADIKSCLEKGISGTRAAPYVDASLCQDLAFDGNYIEVNLSAQYLWLYKGGKCIVSTPIVSGCVFEKNYTPTGVYSIYSKTRSTYLVGADYRSYVDYWMPFLGGYGLHDANWRSSFGGDIYLYDGSHGCVNMPVGAAGTVYDNISVGTKVILYGGATNADPVVQEMSGTAKYEVANNAVPFKLDAKAVYGEDVALIYASDNPAVAEVAADGTVTVKGVGTANITVTAAEKDYYTSAEMKVTVTVFDNCEKNGHSFGKWTEVAAATCIADGSRERICSVCQEKETEAIHSPGHKWGEWTETKAPSCTEDGSKERSCSVCPEKETDVIPGGHKYENWTITKEPTCTAGEETGTCSCGDTTTRPVDPITTEHTYGEPVHTDATCGKAGYNTYTCIYCGNIKAEETDPATGNHAFTSHEQYCGNNCGAENPDYVHLPSTDPSEPSGDENQKSLPPDDDGKSTPSL